MSFDLLGYTYLFIASFLASTILPFGSEGIMLLLISRKYNIIALVIVASVGNFLGSCTTYYIGLKGRSYIERYLKVQPKDIMRAEKYFSKYGSFVLLFTWLPIIGDVFTVTSGLLRLSFTTFSILVFTGKFIRYVVLAYLAGALMF